MKTPHHYYDLSITSIDIFFYFFLLYFLATSDDLA